MSVVVEAGKPRISSHYLKLKKSFLFSFIRKLAEGGEGSIYAQDALILLTRLDFLNIY